MKIIIRYTIVLALTITASVTQADMITTQTTCMTHEQALTYMCKVNLSHHGEPATNIGISVSAVMPSMPMAHNIKPVLAIPVADVPGQYMFVLELEMKGTWRLVYNITRPFVDRLHETLMVGTGDMADQEDHSNHGGHSSDHDNFKAHEMINPENGDIQKVETHERHMELMKLGYVHHGHVMTTNKDSHDSHEMVTDD